MLEIVRCPKSGRIRGIRGTNPLGRLLAPVVGAVALLWVLSRVLSKPSRVTYPCVQVAAPVAASLLGYVVSAGLVSATLRKAMTWFKQRYYLLAAAAALSSAGIAVYGVSLAAMDARAESVGAFTPTDAANSPIGVAQGIKPGRVAWAYDQTATNFTGTGSYADDANTDKVKVRAMLERSICVLSDKPAIADAWAALFQHFNGAQGNGSVGYKAGEKVALKINLNNNGGATVIDATPQSVHALLWELVNVVGVAQADISIYDVMRRTAMGRIKTACQTDFPNVHYNDGGVVSAITFSGGGITTKNVGSEVVNAKYLINMAILKRHGKPDPNWVDSMGNTAVTLTFKNHCGSIDNCSSLHQELRDWNQAFGNYNPLVDLMASKNVGKKTVLFLLDGLYSGNLWNSAPQKWALAPFSGDYPSSLFASLDPVAIDSVGLDFLGAEWPLLANADNYLHEAALIAAPPSKTTYKPDGAAVTQSLGAHEHWNNSTAKAYSRNLDPVNGKGIELVRAEGYSFAAGGTGGTGGASATGGISATGGASSLGGTTGTVVVANGGTINAGGASTATTAALVNIGGATALAASTDVVAEGGGSLVGPATGGATLQTGAAGGPTGDSADDDQGGCGCRMAARGHQGLLVALLGLGLLLGYRRRVSAQR